MKLFVYKCGFIFFGAATGLMNVSINAQAVAVESKRLIHLMSGFHCLFSTGGLFGAIIVSSLLEINSLLPLCAAAISLIIGILLISQWKHLLITGKEEKTTNIEKPRFSFPAANVLLLCVICFISFMAEGSMLDWSAEFLRSDRQYNPSIAGIGYAIFSISMAFGRLVGDRIIKRFTALKIFQAGSFMAAIGFVIVVYPTVKNAELAGFCCIGLGTSNIVPILFTATGKIPSMEAGFSLNIVTTLGYTGALIGPAFIGFLAEATSLALALGAVALCLLAVGASGKQILAPQAYQQVT